MDYLLKKSLEYWFVASLFLAFLVATVLLLPFAVLEIVVGIFKRKNILGGIKCIGC